MYYLAIGIAAGLVSIAQATEFPVDEGSTASMNGETTLTLGGTLIGNWDEETNPDGTRTLPGFWGGSGNNPIPLSLTLGLALDFEGDISGGMCVDIESLPGHCIVKNLSWDLLSSGEPSVDLTISMLYETFRTVQPASLYVGGIAIELPLGSAPLTEARFEQLAFSVGTSYEFPGEPGMYEIEVVVAGLLHVTLEILGTPVSIPLPAALALYGTYAMNETGEAVHLTASVALDESLDLPDLPLPSIPLELPTILPPGSIAHLLLDVAPTTTTIQAQLDLVVDGHVDNVAAPGDANGDGLVNCDDIIIVLSDWGPCKEDCPGDVTGDGLVGVDDILLIIHLWSHEGE